MPELPDIAVFSKNLNHLFSGKKLIRVKVVNGKKLPDTQQKLTKNLNGKVLKRIYRSGKEMRFEFDDHVILGLHLMLTGDIFVFENKNEYPSTVVELIFDNGQGIALTDRMRNAYIVLEPEDKSGRDALELDFEYLKTALDRKTIIKNVFLDQDIIRGIGNGYSDEILWEARISPYSIASAIPDEKIKDLVRIIPKLLREATDKIDKAYPGRINDEVKEFHKIHSKTRTVSPTGKEIIVDTKGMRKTYYTEEQKLYK